MVVLNMRQADQLKKLCWICLKEENKISKLKSDIKLELGFSRCVYTGIKTSASSRPLPTR